MTTTETTDKEINLLALAIHYNSLIYCGKKKKSKCCKSYKTGKICKRCPRNHA